MGSKYFVKYPSFVPSFERYARSIRLDALEDVRKEAEAIFEITKERLIPVFTYKMASIDSLEQAGDMTELVVNGQVFRGKALGALKDVHRVFPYIVTCGTGMEDFDYSTYDILAPYWVDVLKLQALLGAQKALFTHCRERFHISTIQSLNPGSGNVDIWPIEQMKPLFKLLDQGKETGVILSDSSLMIPNKSLAGLLFSRRGSSYESCAYCGRTHCPDRRVPFAKVL